MALWLVSGNIVTSLINVLVLLTPPPFSILHVTVSFLVFYFAISGMQKNSAIWICNHIDGITACTT